MNLFDTLNLNFIFAKMPESVGLLIFGIALIVFTVLVRRVLNWAETSREK